MIIRTCSILLKAQRPWLINTKKEDHTKEFLYFEVLVYIITEIRYVCFNSMLAKFTSDYNLISHGFGVWTGAQSKDKFTYPLHSFSPTVAVLFFFFWILHCSFDFVFQSLISLYREISKLWPDLIRCWSYQHGFRSKGEYLPTFPKILYQQFEIFFCCLKWSNCCISHIFLSTLPKKIRKQPNNNNQPIYC